MSSERGIRTLGVVMMAATALCFSGMALFVRLAARTSPVGVIAMFRYGLGTVVLGALAGAGLFRIRPVNRGLLAWRAIGAAFGGVFYFFALANITIAEAVFLKFTYPLFAVVIAAAVFGEKTGRLVTALMLTGIAGVAVMMNPLAFHPQAGYAWGILNGLAAGISVAVVRKLRETDDAGTIVFFTSVAGVIVSLPFLAHGAALPHTVAGYLYLLFAALFGLLAQLALVYGFRYIPTGAGTVVMMAEVALTALLGYIVLGQGLNANQLIGGAMILFGGGVLLARGRKVSETDR